MPLCWVSRHQRAVPEASSFSPVDSCRQCLPFQAKRYIHVGIFLHSCKCRCYIRFIISTSDFQSEVGKVFGKIGGELLAKFKTSFSSFFCRGKSSEAFSTKTPPQISPSNFTTRFWVVAGSIYYTVKSRECFSAILLSRSGRQSRCIPLEPLTSLPRACFHARQGQCTKRARWR